MLFAPSFWMGGGLESSCVGFVYGSDGAWHTPQAAAFKTTTHPKSGCKKHMLQLNI